MDRLEMSQRFDVMFNNLTSNQAPGLNEYEKSVFLTKAQDQLVNEYFNIRTDGAGGGYDGNQKRQYDFSSLVKVATLDSANIADTEKLDKRSKVFLFPSDYFLAVNELISDDRYQYNVIPLSYGEYSRLMMKPYAYPVKKGAWRLFTKYTPPSNVSNTTINNGEEKNAITITIKEKSKKIAFSLKVSTAALPPSEETSITGFERKTTEYPNDTIVFIYNMDGVEYKNKLIITDFNTGCTTFTLEFYSSVGVDTLTDAQLFCLLNEGFKQLKEDGGISPLQEAGLHLDYFNDIKFSASNSNAIRPTTLVPWGESSLYADIGAKTYVFNSFNGNGSGVTAEVIGRFTGEVNYQLRYIKEPAPIILENLGSDEYTDVRIKGKTEASDCELPEEMHEEILERAVTLAKIAWQGGTVTQVAAAQQNNRNND